MTRDTILSFESKNSARNRLHRIVSDHRVNVSLLVLLGVDVSCVIAGSFFEVMWWESKFHDSEDIIERCLGVGGGGHHRRLAGGGASSSCEGPFHYGNHTFHDAERVLICVSIVILSLFLVEHFIQMYVHRSHFFHHWHHAFDFAIVVLSLVLEFMALTHTLFMSVGIVAAARLWRFARIIHGTAEVISDLTEEGDPEDGHHQNGDKPGTPQEAGGEGPRLHSASLA